MADNDIRRECILELFQSLRPVVNKQLLGIWEDVYTSKEIPQRYWLEKFQLALKTTTHIQSCELRQNISHASELSTTLHKAYVLTGDVYHGEAPQVKASIELLVDFCKEVIVSTARQLWYVPYLVYYITHDKEKAAEGRQELDALIKASIKTTLKQQTGEIILAQRAVVEKYKDHVKEEESEENNENEKEENEKRENESDVESDDLSDETFSTMSSSVTNKSRHSEVEQSPPHHLHTYSHQPSIIHSPSQSPPRSPKYVIGNDLKLTLSPPPSPPYSSRRAPSVTSSSTSSLKALPADGDNINDIYIPRKSNPASLDIPVPPKTKSKAKELLYNMNWYRGNPKLYQYLIAKKKKQIKHKLRE